MAECSRGWGKRCAASKGVRCRCACGGENHGARKPEQDAEQPELTDPRVFDVEFVCSACDAPAERCTCPLGTVVERDYRTFLPGAADVKDVTCTRHEAGALVDIPQRFVYHSPTGFNWGYGGSGPADLALNILGLFVPPPEAWRLHQPFKRAFVARLPHEGGVIRAVDVRDWLLDQWSGKAAAHA